MIHDKEKFLRKQMSVYSSSQDPLSSDELNKIDIDINSSSSISPSKKSEYAYLDPV